MIFGIFKKNYEQINGFKKNTNHNHYKSSLLLTKSFIQVVALFPFMNISSDLSTRLANGFIEM